MAVLTPRQPTTYLHASPANNRCSAHIHMLAALFFPLLLIASVIEISSTGCCATPPAAFRSASPQFAKWSPIWVHDGLSSGSGIRAQKKVPLACCPWFCASATGEWISFAIFANAPLNGYTLPTNPITKLTELLQRLQASFVPPQARFHVFPWPRRRS